MAYKKSKSFTFFGGGTDFPSYYKKKGGCVVGGTIDKYCYVTARYLPNVFDFKHRIVWSKNETVNSYKEIFHPTVRSVFKYMNIKNSPKTNIVTILRHTWRINMALQYNYYFLSLF